MNKLSSDFELDRYGLHVRLVHEEDAEFIVKLRTDSHNAKYLGFTDDDIAKQVEWIREYKRRESESKEYYFIFFKDDISIALYRLYNIDWVHLTYTSGSWVSVPGTDYEITMRTPLIVDYIAQDILGLLVDIYEVRKGNVHVVNYHRNILHALQFGETESDYLFMSTPETRKKSMLKKMLGL